MFTRNPELDRINFELSMIQEKNKRRLKESVKQETVSINEKLEDLLAKSLSYFKEIISNNEFTQHALDFIQELISNPVKLAKKDINDELEKAGENKKLALHEIIENTINEKRDEFLTIQESKLVLTDRVQEASKKSKELQEQIFKLLDTLDEVNDSLNSDKNEVEIIDEKITEIGEEVSNLISERDKLISAKTKLNR